MNNVVVGDLEFEPFITNDSIQAKVKELADVINIEYREKNPVFIGVLNGCFMFMSDLMKEISIPCEMSFVKLASYQGTSQGEISQLLGVGIDLVDRDIIVVEDIVDTGNSLTYTLEALSTLGAKTVTVASLLVKPSCLQYTFNNLKFVGFEIAHEFVVGYGLDYNRQGRNLKNIYRVCSK